MQETQRTVVNCWNEWDPLKHVILGRADGTMVQAPEPAVERDWPDDGFPLGTYGPLPQEMADKANEQLDNFGKILESRGIRVDRPTPLDFGQTVQTPDWKQASMFGCMPPRDVLITIGNQILEATMSYRSRWYEYLCYRPLLEQYFKEDPNMRWEAAPKPRLTGRTYKKDFWKEWRTLSEEEQFERARNLDWALTEVEPLFDAADMMRLGKDIIFQPSMVSNMAGADWIRRHFPNHRIHVMNFKEKAQVHIDSTWIPLRPGLILHNRERDAVPEQLKMYEINDWEIVECVQPQHRAKRRLSYCSIWLSINLLILNPKTVCVEASETAQMEQLDKLGFEVIPVPYYDVAPFGGGLHCSTTDIYREGACEDYFPRQVEGF
ncbi:MAG: serine/threonine protein kinase [Desulfobacteraceae bacterium]|nr:serine/threonine protein kinase [Desulfobacteraceae bacterium]